MSVASSIIAAADNVYSPGIRKYNEKECAVSSSGGTSRVIPLNTPTRKVTMKGQKEREGERRREGSFTLLDWMEQVAEAFVQRK